MSDQQPVTKKIVAVWPEWSATREYTVGAQNAPPKLIVTALGWEVTKKVAEDFDVQFSPASYREQQVQLFPPLPQNSTLSDLPDDMPLVALVSPPQSFTNNVRQRIHNQRDALSEMRKMMVEMQQTMERQNDKKMEEMRKTINVQHDKKMEEMRKTVNVQYDKKMEGMRKTINAQNKKMDEMRKTMEEMRGTINGQNKEMEEMRETIKGQNEKMEEMQKTINVQNKKMDEMRKTINGQNKKMEEMRKKINEKERQMEEMERQHEKTVDGLKKDIVELKRNLAELQKSYEGLQHSVSYLHLRYLLDEARIKVETDLGESLDSLRKICKEKSHDLAGYIHSHLANSSFPLPKASIYLICYPNAIRDQGNYAAHNATQDQVHLAIMRVDAQDKRAALVTLYEYVFVDRIVV